MANLSTVATTNADGSTSLRMFWLDAYEKRGTVYLFGKVRADKSNPSAGFVSCCLVVKNNMRSMFVLPRVDPDTGEPFGMMDVHRELKSVLQPSCIPLRAGASFAAKKVKRRYAFECEGVPREEVRKWPRGAKATTLETAPLSALDAKQLLRNLGPPPFLTS